MRQLIIHFALGLITCINLTINAQPLQQVSPKAHRHVMLLESVLESVSPEFSIVETSLAANSKKEDLVTNRSQTYDAFTISGTKLFVTERKTGKHLRFEVCLWSGVHSRIWFGRTVTRSFLIAGHNLTSAYIMLLT